MAVSSRLYPPNIAGTLPSFYKDSSTGTAKLVVPFTMNTAVVPNAVKGFYLRLKTTTTDTLLIQMSTTLWDRENYVVEFELNATVLDKMIIGNYYKAQIAYISTGGLMGYYSTSSVIKYTAEPQVIIQGLVANMVTSTQAYKFIGQYTNTNDMSEKVYSYRWTLQGTVVSDNGIVVKNVDLDTGWLIHDSSMDESNSMSIDDLELTELLSSGTSYTIQYAITTNNGLIVYSPIYQIVSTTNLGEQLPFTVHADLDYENGRMRISFDRKYTQITQFAGSYQLMRADSRSGYLIWTTLGNFVLTQEFERWVYWDYTVESGVAYKYGMEKINNNVRSARQETNVATPCYFECAFLYDGDRQLKIQLNANVNSIKDVVAETKKTTLGSKYPFVLRNGVLKYREFPITGMISYLTDKDVLFISKTSLLDPNLMSTEAYLAEAQPGVTRLDVQLLKDYADLSDFSDRNITMEKNFALTALEWLNNGEIKLFKSPQEGNYIVKLLNVSLAPVNNTGRMLHTFTCTADEVQDFSTTALIKYNILRGISGQADADGRVWYENYTVRSLAQLRDEIHAKYIGAYGELQAAEETKKDIMAIDLTENRYVTKIEISQATEGLEFQYGTLHFMIPKSGTYVIQNSDRVQQPLNIVNLGTKSHMFVKGIVAISYDTVTSDTNTYVDSVSIRSYLGFSSYGSRRDFDDEREVREAYQVIMENTNLTAQQKIEQITLLAASHNFILNSKNILEEFKYYKRKIVKVYDTKRYSYPFRENPALFSSTGLGMRMYDGNSGAFLVDKYGNLFGEWVFLHNSNTKENDPIDGDKYFTWTDLTLPLSDDLSQKKQEELENIRVDETLSAEDRSKRTAQVNAYYDFRQHLLEVDRNTLYKMGGENTEYVNLIDYAQGDVAKINTEDMDTVYYSLGNATAVNFYLLIQDYDFAVEQTDSALITAKANVDQKRKDYLMELFHFMPVQQAADAEDGGLFIYADERFVEYDGSFDNAQEYYTVNPSEAYNPIIIESLHQSWLNAYKAYNVQLKKAIEDASGTAILDPQAGYTDVTSPIYLDADFVNIVTISETAVSRATQSTILASQSTDINQGYGTKGDVFDYNTRLHLVENSYQYSESAQKRIAMGLATAEKNSGITYTTTGQTSWVSGRYSSK